MISIELEHKLILCYSKRFREKNYMTQYKYLDENGMLIEEKAFQVERDEESIEKQFTYFIIGKIVWIFSFIMILIAIVHLNITFTIIALVVSGVLYLLNMRLRENFIISEMGKNLTISVYDNLIAKKYNLDHIPGLSVLDKDES